MSEGNAPSGEATVTTGAAEGAVETTETNESSEATQSPAEEQVQEATSEESTEETSEESSGETEKATEEDLDKLEDLTAEEFEELAGTAEESEDSTAEVKKYKVKIDGKEVEVTEDELLKGYQKSKAANRRFEEAAKMRKYADQIIEAVKSSPIEVLEKLGKSRDEIRKTAEDYLIDLMEQENLTPEERALREKEAELERYREAERARKEQEQQEHYAKIKAEYEEQIDGEIVEALQGSGLPPSTYTIRRMAQYLSRSIDNDLGLGPKELVKYVKKDYDEEMNTYLGSLSGDQLLDRLPKPVLDKVRKALVARVKSKRPVEPTKIDSTPKSTQNTDTKEQAKPMTMDEWREWRDNFQG